MSRYKWAARISGCTAPERRARLLCVFAVLLIASRALAFASDAAVPAHRMARIKDVASIEGIRDNQLVGYGLVIGLNGTGNDADNTITGGAGANNLLGLGGNDSIVGGAGNDTLDGGTGHDTLDGGLGNDIFVVDSTLDVIVEAPAGGTDTVKSSVSYSLAAYADVENLTLTGDGAIDATGNAGNNWLTGNAGSNVLDGNGGIDNLTGLFGNDTYIVDGINDKITEAANAGTDTVVFTGTAGTTYVLPLNVENLVLGGHAAINGTGGATANVITGNDAGNVLTGAAGNDTLDGGAGADTLIGGANDDTYIVDNVGDRIDEATGGTGIDTVQSSVDFSLVSGTALQVRGGVVENLILTGTGDIAGTGSASANQLLGNSGANLLIGGAGSDLLSGGGGEDTLRGGLDHDTLFGGAGNDVFTYDDSDFGGSTGVMASHSDSLFDFAAGDRFDLTGLISTDDITLT